MDGVVGLSPIEYVSSAIRLGLSYERFGINFYKNGATSTLGSYAGLVAATYLLVQFFKDPIRLYLNDWWVRILAVIIAFAIQVFVLYVGSKISVETVGLALLNAFLIAIAAAGTHEISKSKPDDTLPVTSEKSQNTTD